MENNHIKILRPLTVLLAVILLIVSAAGAFLPSTYARDAASMAAQGIGQDIVNLLLVVPLLMLSFYYYTKKNRTGTLVYGGTLFYILYSFIIYCFGVHFNRLFLLYCSTLGLSLYAFIIYFRDILKADVSTWFDRAPVKTVSVYIFAVAIVFYALWFKALVPALIRDTVPAEVSDYGLLVNPVHVIDLAFALPGLIIGAVLIRERKSAGYIIASLALVFMIILTIALAGMVITLAVRGISEDYTIAVVFGILTLFTIAVAYLLFRRIMT